MEIDGQTATHEQRMEDYARRQTKALETLRTIALWLVALLAVGTFFGVMIWLQANSSSGY